MKQRLGTNTHIHASLRGSWVMVTWQLGWNPDSQALEEDPSWTLTKPPPQGVWEAQGSCECVRVSWECHQRAAWPGGGSLSSRPKGKCREKVKLLTEGSKDF